MQIKFAKTYQNMSKKIAEFTAVLLLQCTEPGAEQTPALMHQLAAKSEQRTLQRKANNTTRPIMPSSSP